MLDIYNAGINSSEFCGLFLLPFWSSTVVALVADLYHFFSRPVLFILDLKHLSVSSS